MAYFVEEPLFFKKLKYCKPGYEIHFCSFLYILLPAIRCWEVSHALTGTSAIPLPSLEKQQCNLGELYKTSGGEDTRRARRLPFFLFSCIGLKSNISKVRFHSELRKSDHWLKSIQMRRWLLQVTCFLYVYMGAYCEGLRRFLNTENINSLPRSLPSITIHTVVSRLHLCSKIKMT